MNENERISDGDSQGSIVIASIACFFVLLLVYGVAHTAVELLKVRWAEFLVYAAVPLAVTYAILYRSHWHREIVGAARTFSIMLVSAGIVIGVVMATAFMLCLLVFGVNAVSGGFHP